MGHHHHHHSHGDNNLREMHIAFWLNFAFTIIEFVGGLLTNSFAIITDAFHDLGDSIALGLGIWLEKVAKRKPSDTFTYGYRRFSLLSAVILSGILIVGSVLMIIKAVENLFRPHEVASLGMMGLAVLGILVNGLAFWRMAKQAKSEGKANSRAMSLHFLEDVLGWVAVLVGGIVIHFTGWAWIDSLLSLGIAIFILRNAVPNLVSVFRVLLQQTPNNLDVRQLKQDILHVKQVQKITQMHLWSEDGIHHIATLHLQVASEHLCDADNIRHEVTHILQDADIHNITIQIESILCEQCNYLPSEER